MPVPAEEAAAEAPADPAVTALDLPLATPAEPEAVEEKSGFPGAKDAGAAAMPEPAQPPAPSASSAPLGGVLSSKLDERPRLAREKLDSSAEPTDAKPESGRIEPAEPSANGPGEGDAGWKESVKKKAENEADAATAPEPAHSPVSPPDLPADRRAFGYAQPRGAAMQSNAAGNGRGGADSAQTIVDALKEKEAGDAYGRRLDSGQSKSSLKQRGFAQRLQWEARRSEVVAPETSPAAGRDVPPTPGDFGPGFRPGPGGGIAAGDAAAGPGPARRPAPSDPFAGEQDAEAGYGAGPPEAAAAAQPPASPRLVRVLFVLRAVHPEVDVAADIAADAPPTSAARSLQTEPPAEAEASEAVIEAETSPVRE
jgi:hypothetical protein